MCAHTFCRFGLLNFFCGSLLFLLTLGIPMDPRRARDPRLARVDPRLQRIQSETTPTPPLPSTQPEPSSPENGIINYTAPPQEVAVLHQPPESSLPSQQAASQASPSTTYKPRPMFCVVCASNQVSLSFPPLVLYSRA